MTDPEWTTEQRWAGDEDYYQAQPEQPVVRPTGPGALTSARERWDGCPYGFHPAHDGPCP